MKVLFLDIDGVLNSAETFKGRDRKGRERIEPACVQQLNQIIAETDARIVISSAWRASGLNYVRAVLERYGLVHGDAIIDGTPQLCPFDRGAEIQAWLDEHAGVTVFAILDDDAADMGALLPRVIQTSFDTGLAVDHARQAIALLGPREGGVNANHDREHVKDR